MHGLTCVNVFLCLHLFMQFVCTYTGVFTCMYISEISCHLGVKKIVYMLFMSSRLSAAAARIDGVTYVCIGA